MNDSPHLRRSTTNAFSHRFQTGSFVLPELTVSGTASPEPLVLKYTSPLDLGTGVDPVDGDLALALLTTIPSSTATPGTQTYSKSNFMMVSTQQFFDQALSIDATASLYTQAVNGTASASYLQSLSLSNLTLTCMAAGMTLNGSYSPSSASDLPPDTWSVSAVDASPVVTAIATAGSYDDFIAQYGTHFIGGILYGNQYDACVTALYQNVATQQSAAASVSASGGFATTSGEFSGSIVTQMQNGNASQSVQWSQTAIGSFQPQPSASVDAVNANLSNFPTATPAAICYLLYDWRIFPTVAAAAGTLTFDFNDYLDNLPDIQTAVAQLSYIANTCSAMIGTTNYEGSTNLQYLQSTLSTVTLAIAALLNYTPAAVADFNVTSFMATYSNCIPQLTLISNGMFNVQVTAALDGTFNPSSAGPQNFSVPPGSGGRYGFTLGKSNGEDWFFGFQVPGAATIQATQGLIVTGGGLASKWSNQGPIVGYAANNQDASSIVSGVGSGGATYPWLQTTATLI